MSLCYYFSTENLEEMTLDLKHEKDGKQVGEVVVGLSGLRPRQTSGSSTCKPQTQHQYNEPNQPRPQQQNNPIPPGMMLPPGTSEK